MERHFQIKVRPSWQRLRGEVARGGHHPRLKRSQSRNIQFFHFPSRVKLWILLLKNLLIGFAEVTWKKPNTGI